MVLEGVSDSTKDKVDKVPSEGDRTKLLDRSYVFVVQEIDLAVFTEPTCLIQRGANRQ